MDGFSVLDCRNWDAAFVKEQPAYIAGNALGWLYKGNKQAAINHPLVGRLYLAKSGWLLLSVPNALVRGIFDALGEPGAELPRAGVMNVPNVKDDLLNAHISVMTADEVASIGANKITERGHTFNYTLAGLQEVDVKNINGVSKVWTLQVVSSSLAALRKSYGLSPTPKNQPFHVTFAVRRRGVLNNNAVSKCCDEQKSDSSFKNPISRGELKAAAVKDVLHGGEADNKPDSEFNPKQLAEGVEHEHEHTDQNQIAKEIAKDHLSEDPLYYKKVEQIENYKVAESVYWNALKNQLTFREPIPYDPSKPVFENVKNQMHRLKARGDMMLQTRYNDHLWRTQLDPQYRYEMALRAVRGQPMPGPSAMDRLIYTYGTDALGRSPFMKVVDHGRPLY